MKPVTPIASAAPGRTENVTFRYKDVSSKGLHDALAKLDEFTGWTDPKDIHRFNKLKQAFDREEKKAGHYYRKLVYRHAIMEDLRRKNKETDKMEVVIGKDGKPVQKPKWAPDEHGQMQMAMKDVEAFEKDQAIFHAHEFTIKVFQFLADDLVKAGLTPAEIRACARLMNEADPDLYEDTDVPELEMDEDVPDDLRDVIFPKEQLDGPDPDSGSSTERGGRSSGASAPASDHLVHAERRKSAPEDSGENNSGADEQGRGRTHTPGESERALQ